MSGKAAAQTSDATRSTPRAAGLGPPSNELHDAPCKIHVNHHSRHDGRANCTTRARRGGGLVGIELEVQKGARSPRSSAGWSAGSHRADAGERKRPQLAGTDGQDHRNHRCQDRPSIDVWTTPCSSARCSPSTLFRASRRHSASPGTRRGKGPPTARRRRSDAIDAAMASIDRGRDGR